MVTGNREKWIRSGGSRASERFSPTIFAYDETGGESWEKGKWMVKVEIQILKIILVYVFYQFCVNFYLKHILFSLIII